MFWRKKTATISPEAQPEPQPLTGIEKMERERIAEIRYQQALDNERRFREVSAQIHKIESEIAPQLSQLQQLQQLRAQIQPKYWHQYFQQSDMQQSDLRNHAIQLNNYAGILQQCGLGALGGSLG